MIDTKEVNKKNFLILGGHGKTGSRVVKRLTERGYSVRIGSRSEKLPFDWENRSTWEAVLNNIDSVYITFQPDLAVPGAVETVSSFVKTAVKQGVKQLVLLAGRGEASAEETEQAVKDSDVDWTILRSNWFSQNFSENFFLDPIISGYVALPAGDVGEPFVDLEDLADVATAALTEKGHSGQTYVLSGPRLLTFQEAIKEISQATGRDITYKQITITEYVAMLKKLHVPQVYVDLLEYLFSEVLDGRNAHVADGVERALGRKPTDFSEYARRTALTGVWNKK